jgi:5'-nucleotidase
MGAHMPPILNAIGVHVAAIGNHDFDFGVSQLVQLTKGCSFPWLMANVLDKATSEFTSIHEGLS